MTRAAAYVVALRTSASGSSTKATSNTYVTTVKNSILANTNTYIKSQLANTNTYIATKSSSTDHNLSTYIALGIF
jgi:hypothetical protein